MEQMMGRGREKEISADKIRELVGRAKEQLGLAYAPYSGFHVAAALLSKDGRIYTGCNVENASYPAGKREFSCIVIMGGAGGRVESYCPPCGICRQALREFCRPSEFFVILARSEEDYRIFTLEELLPESFGPEALI